MRRLKFDFYDFLLVAVSFLSLILTVPGLPRWTQFGIERKLAVGALMCLGFMALWVLLHRPVWLKDSSTDSIDLFDIILAASVCLLAAASVRSAVRWSQSGMTVHRSAIVIVI